MGRIRRCGAAALLLALGAAASVVPSGAQASTVFYRASAQANAEFVEVRRPGYILEPILQVNALDTQTTITSTGTRDALASLLNPGPIGDFPALLGLAVAGLPPIPYPGYPLTTTASHPLTPESTLGVGDLPGGDAGDAANVRAYTAAARAGEDFAESMGTGAGFSLAAGLVRVGGVESRTRADDDGGFVTVTAETRFAGIELAGLVEIESLETRSVATIDNDTVSIDTSTTVGAIRALGAELALDDNGLRVVTVLGIPAPPPIVLDGLTAQIERALEGAGLQVRLVEGGLVEGPADGTTTYQNVGAGLEITLPLTIPADVAIPSLPIPLGIPIGGGIPTNVTVALGRARVSAVAGTGAGFGAPSTPQAPTTSGGSTGPAAAPPIGGGGTAGSAGGFAAPAAAANVVAPASGGASGDPTAPITPATTVAVALPDFTPAFRWALLTAISAIVLGWPLARRRLAGVPGLTASGVLRSLTNPRESR